MHRLWQPPKYQKIPVKTTNPEGHSVENIKHWITNGVKTFIDRTQDHLNGISMRNIKWSTSNVSWTAITGAVHLQVALVYQMLCEKTIGTL